MNADIEHLVRRAKAGEKEAISALYRSYAQVIYRYIYYRVPTASDAEDLTAEVFLKMVEGLPGYHFTGAPFEAWLYRIAAARITDFYRRSRRRPQTEVTENLVDTRPVPEDQLEDAQEIESLKEVLSSFDPDEQTILLLRFVERKSHKEVADIMGKSVSAVKSAQHRALSKLANIMGSGKVRHYLRGDHD